jgi:hypothetical protein
LNNIKEDATSKIAWSSISAREIEEAGAKENEIEGVINELLSTVPDAKIVLLLTERKPGLVSGSMRTNLSNIPLDKIALIFGGGGHPQAAGFKIEGMGLAEAEKIVLTELRSYLISGSVNALLKKETVYENKKEEPREVKTILENKKEQIDSDEYALYAPTLSDIDNDEAKIVDDKSSILHEIVNKRSQVKSEKEGPLDFAKMEEDLRKNSDGGVKLSASDDYFDEDYE